MVTFYEILNVAPDATFDAIKSAYKKQALLHHPDKTQNGDDTHFKKIREAYDTLSDPLKRQIYDNTILKGIHDDIVDWKEFMNNMINNIWQLFLQLVDIEKRTVVLKVTATLDDLFHCKVKKLNVKVKRWQHDSSTLATELVPIYVSLLDYKKTTHTFQGLGDDCILHKFPRGDIRVNVEVEPHPFIKIDSVFGEYDLFMEKKITLYEYYYATEFELDIFGDRIVIPYQSGQKTAQVPDYGLPYPDPIDPNNNIHYGTLYVHFDLELPQIEHNCELESLLVKHFHKQQ